MRPRTKLNLLQFGFASMLPFALAIASSAQEQDRSKIPDQYKWDLTKLYSSDQAWRDAKNQLAAELPKMAQFKGTLSRSPQRLADALEMESTLEKEFYRLSTYAGLISDQDTRVSVYQGMQQEITQLGATFGADTAFIEPEILTIEDAKLRAFLAQEPRLNVYRHYLDDVTRRRPHIGTDAEEKLLAASSVISSGPSNTYNIFSNADFPHPSITLSDGKTTKLTSSEYELQRASPNRSDREKVMSTFFKTLGDTGEPLAPPSTPAYKHRSFTRMRDTTILRSTLRSMVQTSRPLSIPNFWKGSTVTWQPFSDT